MTTTALLCVAKHEQPFTDEWLEYHLGLGFDRVYYVSTDSDTSLMDRFFQRSPFRDRVELSRFDTENPSWQVRCYNEHLPRIREEWVLPLDVDEFLYLHAWDNIQDFLTAAPRPVNQIQFPWLNVISGDYWHERTFDSLNGSRPRVSDHVKSIARVQDVVGLNVHAHFLRRAECRLSSGRAVSPAPRHGSLLTSPRRWVNHPLILHFCSRGHLDVLIRIAEQSFFNQKCGSSERERLRSYLRDAPNWETIPNRYLLLQLWASMPEAEVDLNLPALESRTDLDQLNATFRASMNRLLDADEQLEDAPIENVAKRFESRHRLAGKIEEQTQAAHFDLKEYSAQPAPLIYVQKRRAALIRSEHRRRKRATRVGTARRVFIHVSKNAGTSIVAAAGENIHNAGHRTARSWIREQGAEHSLFAVIRNPFDRAVSEYFYRKRRYDAGDRDPHLANLTKSFEEWALSTYRDGEMRTRAYFQETGIPFYKRHLIDDQLIWFVPQTAWLCDGRGHLLVHDLLRFENLQWDWLCWAEKQSLAVPLTHRNMSPRRRDYRPYYTAETRALIADHYRDDFEAFGYVF